MLLYVDIDGTICTITNGKYEEAQPIKENINKINKLFDEGNTIVYWTARGSGTGIDWEDVTKNQLDSWGAKYHNVKLKKPFYDIFIDDKAINTKDFFV